MEQNVSKILHALIDKPFRLLVAPDGSVKSITGLDKVRDSLAQAAAAADAEAQHMVATLKELFSDAVVKEWMEESFNHYPNKAIHIGDSWHIEATRAMGGIQRVLKTKYTLKEVKKNTATLVYESEIEGTMAAPAAKFVGTQRGSMTVDTPTGILQTLQVSQHADSSFEAEGTAMLVKTTTQTKISTKELKK